MTGNNDSQTSPFSDRGRTRSRDDSEPRTRSLSPPRRGGHHHHHRSNIVEEDTIDTVLHGSIPLLSFEYEPSLPTITERDNHPYRLRSAGGCRSPQQSCRNIDIGMIEDNMDMVMYGSYSSSFSSIDFVPGLTTISEVTPGNKDHHKKQTA